MLEIIFFAVSMIIFILWLSSILWGAFTDGIKQIGRDEKWMKIYIYIFPVVSLLLGTEIIIGAKSFWNSNFIGEVSLYASILFVIVCWFLLWVGGGSILFEGKQNKQLLGKYSATLMESKNIIKEFAKKQSISDELNDYIKDLLERIDTLESCKHGDPYSAAKLY